MSVSYGRICPGNYESSPVHDVLVLIWAGVIVTLQYFITTRLSSEMSQFDNRRTYHQLIRSNLSLMALWQKPACDWTVQPCCCSAFISNACVLPVLLAWVTRGGYFFKHAGFNSSQVFGDVGGTWGLNRGRCAAGPESRAPDLCRRPTSLWAFRLPSVLVCGNDPDWQAPLPDR